MTRISFLVGTLAAVAGCASTQSAPPSAPVASGAAPTAAAPAAAAPAASAAGGGAAAPRKAAVPGKRTPYAIAGAKWYVYDGMLLPNESAAAFTEGGGSGGSAAGFSAANGNGTVSFDSQDPANKATWVFAPAIEGSPKSFTFVARMKADDQSDRGFDIEFRFGDKKAGKQGPRAKFILKPNEVQIEKPDGESASTQKFRLEGTDYHTYQLAFDINGDQVVTNVYLDGSDKPIMTTQGNQLVGDNRFAFGDMGSNTCKGSIDWMIWTDTAALKPSALKGKLPPPIGDVTAY